MSPFKKPLRSAQSRLSSSAFRDRPVRCAVRGLIPGLLLILALAACPQTPRGPGFVVAPAPSKHRARLYIYRADPRSSLSEIRVTLDGLEVGLFRDAEYETMEVAAGSHNLRAGLRSLGFVAWGWNTQRIRLTPGETVYIELSVRLTERPTPSGQETRIAGRESGAASENVFIQRRGEPTARKIIRTTTRLPTPNTR